MNSNELATPAFYKKCPYCGASWENMDDFLTDQSVGFVGYQPNFKDLALGLFLFNHSECRTTMALYAEQFQSLYDGPIFNEHQAGADDCLESCLHKDERGSHLVKCECAFVREVLNIVREWPKTVAV